MVAPASTARNVVALRTFFKYLQLDGIVVDNPAELLATQKMWQRVPGVLTHRQVDAFLAAPFLMGQYKFLMSKKKYGPALTFLGLRLTRPVWSLML